MFIKECTIRLQRLTTKILNKLSEISIYNFNFIITCLSLDLVYQNNFKIVSRYKIHHIFLS